MLERQASFSEAELYGQSRKVVHDRLLELVSLSGGNANTVRDSIQVRAIGGTPLWKTVQLDALYVVKSTVDTPSCADVLLS